MSGIIDRSEIVESIERGLEFLYKNQLPNGEFRCYWSNHPTMTDAGTLDNVPIVSSFIAYSLSFSPSATAKYMIQEAAKYLTSEMLEFDVWKYWTPNNPYYSYLPPDVDDTACAAIVLKQVGAPPLDNIELILANRDPRGRLYTWYVPRLAPIFYWRFWQLVLRLNLLKTFIYFYKFDAVEPDDVDGVINANVLAYLGPIPGTEGIIKYLLEIAEQGLEADCDKWYRNPLIFYYSLSRNYSLGMSVFEKVKDKIIDRIKNSVKEDGRIGETDFDLALATCALLNFENRSTILDNAIVALIRAQKGNGNWRRSAFYYAGPQHAGPQSYHGWGSEELTTGFCLEALTRYEKIIF